MNKFLFQEFDLEGLATLDAISVANKFNKWMYETIRPFCEGEILEVGSGIGNISCFLLENNFLVTLSDINEDYCNILNYKFGSRQNLRDILHIDLAHPNFDYEYKYLFNSFDCLIALNVVEHIEDDIKAIGNCYKLLRKGGRLIILVPAYQALYNTFDKNLGHYRRYTKKSLKDILTKNKLQPLHSQHFNLVGIAGWFIFGTLLKRKGITSGLMNSYNSLVPVFKIADMLCLNRWGLSVIAVGKK